MKVFAFHETLLEDGSRPKIEETIGGDTNKRKEPQIFFGLS